MANDILKALSIRQPWAHLILHWGKDVENRTWRTDYRGPLVIHSSKAYDHEAHKHLTIGTKLIGDANHRPAHRTAARGALVGIVELVDVVQDADSPWAEEDCWHWMLENPRPLPAPLSWKGQLGLWSIDFYDLCFPTETDEQEAAIKMLLGVMGAERSGDDE